MSHGFPLPKQPVVEWAWTGGRAAELPSLLDLPNSALTHSGRSAIVLALQLLGVKHGDGILVPTYHCPTMIAPVEYVGGVPVFYPVTPAGTPDLAYLERCSTRGVRAILVPHLFGLPHSLEVIAALCRSRGMFLIEDCAHCFFGMAGATPVGTTGDFAVGSLPKFFPTIEGGILASTSRPVPSADLPARSLKDEMRAAWDLVDLAARSGRLGIAGSCARGGSRLRGALRRGASESGLAEGDVSAERVRSRSLQDQLLAPAAARRIEAQLVQRADFARIVRRRREIFQTLANGLADLPNAAPLVRECGPGSAPYVMPLLVRDPELPYANMRAARLPVFRWDRRWPGTPMLPGDSASLWTRGIIQIACHQSLTDAEVHEIIDRALTCLAQG